MYMYTVVLTMVQELTGTVCRYLVYVRVGDSLCTWSRPTCVCHVVTDYFLDVTNGVRSGHHRHGGLRDCLHAATSKVWSLLLYRTGEYRIYSKELVQSAVEPLLVSPLTSKSPLTREVINL